jgi:hypothetical protein
MSSGQSRAKGGAAATTPGGVFAGSTCMHGTHSIYTQGLARKTCAVPQSYMQPIQTFNASTKHLPTDKTQPLPRPNRSCEHQTTQILIAILYPLSTAASRSETQTRQGQQTLHTTHIPRMFHDCTPHHWCAWCQGIITERTHAGGSPYSGEQMGQLPHPVKVQRQRTW